MRLRRQIDFMSETESDTFIIRSTATSSKLTISDFTGECFTATLISENLSAIVLVWPITDSHGFPNLLDRLARYDKPWDGEESWAGLEGDFKFSASCSSLGSVTFKINLRHFGSEGWTVDTELRTEMGELQGLASASRLFFGPSPY